MLKEIWTVLNIPITPVTLFSDEKVTSYCVNGESSYNLMPWLYVLKVFVPYRTEYQIAPPVPVLFGLSHLIDAHVELMASIPIFLGSEGGSEIGDMSTN